MFVSLQITERSFEVEIILTVSGQDLKYQICQQVRLNRELKLICAGKVIDDFELLSSQRVKVSTESSNSRSVNCEVC